MLFCFVIVFGSVSKPVKAIAGLDDAVYFVLGSFCLSLAVDIAVDNPATGEELLRLWNALSDGSQRAVQAAANGIVWYGNTVYDWEVETWTSVANEIKSWFDDNHSSGTDFGEVVADNANGYSLDLYPVDFCNKTGLSDSTYRRAFTELEEKGYLLKHRTMKNTYMFR